MKHCELHNWDYINFCRMCDPERAVNSFLDSISVIEDTNKKLTSKIEELQKENRELKDFNNTHVHKIKALEREVFNWTLEKHPLRDTFYRIELLLNHIQNDNIKRLFEIELSNIKGFSGYIKTLQEPTQQEGNS